MYLSVVACVTDTVIRVRICIITYITCNSKWPKPTNADKAAAAKAETRTGGQLGIYDKVIYAVYIYVEYAASSVHFSRYGFAGTNRRLHMAIACQQAARTARCPRSCTVSQRTLSRC